MTVFKGLRRCPRIPANNRNGVGGDGGHKHQLLGALDLNLVAQAKSLAMRYRELRRPGRIADHIVVDGVLVGQQFVFQPFVMRARCRPQAVAQNIQQRRLIRRDD